MSVNTLASSVWDSIYPIGSIYINATNSANPDTLLGFGTWVAFGAGRVPVGFDAGQTEFNASEKTGGDKTHTLTVSEMPSHKHNISLEFGTNVNLTTGPPGQYNQVRANGATYYSPGTGTGANTGGSQPHNNLQPYITVYMWKRTA